MTSAFGSAASRADALPTTRSALTSALADVKHADVKQVVVKQVVVLMQENRSFDH